MTSRRSRLKAVTNLPVRRKGLTSQGSADETVSVENLSAQKIYSFVQKSEVITASNIQKDYEIQEKESNEDESAEIVNYTDDVQGSENCINENVINKSNEPEIVGVLENTDNLTRNLPSLKTDYSNDSIQSSKCFKPNLMTSSREGHQLQSLEENQGKQSPDKQNCTLNNNINKHNNNKQNNNNNNNNNNILEDGNKCYAVLTTQNVTLPPLSEYTITPLTPCDNAYVSPSVCDEFPPQEYEEVHIYTDIENNELYVNEESVVETGPPESVLIKISNNCSNSEISNMHINFESLDSNYVEPNNAFVKSGLKNKTASSKSSYSESDDYYKNINQQTKYTHMLENSVTSGSHISTEVYSYRQCVSNARRKRSKCNEITKKLADAKREFQKKYEKSKPDRSTLKMIDLIFYNPATNPMESKNKFEKKDALIPASDEIHNSLAEEKVDEPESLDDNLISQGLDNDDTENMNKMPVPQVKIGLDGEIILDEKSIIIETTDAKRGREGLQNSVPIFEDRGCRVSYYRGKSRKSRDWTDFETKRFYKALNTIGPDFSLMQKYFPKRSRLELKNKFKREEKLNRNLIDKALNNPSEFDMTELEKDLAVEKEVEEEEIEMRLCRIVKHSTRKPRVKSSVLSREMIESDGESENGLPKSNDSDFRQSSEIEKNKKKREFDFVLQKLLLKDSEKS